MPTTVMLPEDVATLFVKHHYDKAVKAALFGYSHMASQRAMEEMLCESDMQCPAPELETMKELLLEAGVDPDLLASIREGAKVL